MWLSNFISDFKFVFLESERYKLIIEGLFVTLEITLFAVLIGIALGTVVASIRSTYDKNIESLKKRKNFKNHHVYLGGFKIQLFSF